MYVLRRHQEVETQADHGTVPAQNVDAVEIAVVCQSEGLCRITVQAGNSFKVVNWGRNGYLDTKTSNQDRYRSLISCDLAGLAVK